MMDFQYEQLGGVEEPQALLARAQRAQQSALQAGMRVIHVRVAFTPAAHEAIPPHNKAFAPIASAGTFAQGHPSAEIHHELRADGREHVITKTRVSAFSGTSLDRQLRGRGIDTLCLAGISTSGVVLSTVRDAADRDYRLFVLSDVCADADATLHDFLVRYVLPQHADMVTVADWEAAIAS
ncbi:hypothetical protein A5717_24410 [Mycolicibacterium porcinum]|nr:hypothetical protein A5717_24410 [Mycolicibacterium porcinum]